MKTIVNIPYLTSGRQITHPHPHSNSNSNSNSIEQNEQLYRNKMEQKILERRQSFLKLSDGFRSAFNYKTFPEKSD